MSTRHHQVHPPSSVKHNPSVNKQPNYVPKETDAKPTPKKKMTVLS